MAIVKDKSGNYFNIDDAVLRTSKIDPLDLPEGAAFGEADELGDDELDAISGGNGSQQYTRTRTVAMGVRG